MNLFIYFSFWFLLLGILVVIFRFTGTHSKRNTLWCSWHPSSGQLPVLWKLSANAYPLKNHLLNDSWLWVACAVSEHESLALCSFNFILFLCSPSFLERGIGRSLLHDIFSCSFHFILFLCNRSLLEGGIGRSLLRICFSPNCSSRWY